MIYFLPRDDRRIGRQRAISLLVVFVVVVFFSARSSVANVTKRERERQSERDGLNRAAEFFSLSLGGPLESEATAQQFSGRRRR